MKRFAIKAVAFILINILIGGAVLTVVNSRYAFKQYETDSILLPMPRDTHYGVLIMGTSRGQLFTRYKDNLETVETAFGANVYNLSIPFGGGILPSKMFLTTFFERGNRADTVLYFIDPFVMFSPKPNREHRLVNYEPLWPTFLWQMVKNDMPRERIVTYIQSKFTKRWFTQTPQLMTRNNKRMHDDQVNPEKVKMRNDSLYFDGLNEQHFQTYAAVLDDILERANHEGCRVILAFPPTLLGEQPGSDRLLAELEKLHKKRTFEFHDFSNTIQDPAQYFDYDHLNSDGVEKFTKEYLKPIINRP